MFTGGMFTVWRGWLIFDPAAPDLGAVYHTESATPAAEAAAIPRREPVLDYPANDPGWNDFGWVGAASRRDPVPETSFEQDAKDAAASEDRLLGLLAVEVDVLGATPLQAARRLFGGSRA